RILAVAIGSRGRPPNRGRSCVADHTFGARCPPVARARGVDEPDWCDARPVARRHRSVSGDIVRETRRRKPRRRDQGCFSATRAGAVGPGANATGTPMSLKTVQLIVGRLVTDEEYRLKFLSDPIHTLTTLRNQGVELTSAEIDALIRTDRTLWSDAAARIDRDLQRSSWLAD